MKDNKLIIRIKDELKQDFKSTALKNGKDMTFLLSNFIETYIEENKIKEAA